MIELIRQVRLVDPVTDTDRVADVRVVDGRIDTVDLDLAIAPADTVIDGQGKLLLPGLVDLHSHSGEPGHESRETLAQLLAAAQAGGFTRIGLLPTTQPAANTPGAIRDIGDRHRQLAASQPLPQLWIWAALTQGEEQMTELAELAATEAVGFAAPKPISNSLLRRRLLEYLHPFQKPVMLWASDPALSQGLARDGRYALRFGLPGDPVSAESGAIAALLEQVRETQTPIHLMQVSTARGVELIAEAKAQGLPITASTSWMHLLHSTRSLGTYDPSLRLEPPLGNPEDQAALVEAVQSGAIDAIAVDHRAYTYEEKTVGFAVAPTGAIGLPLVLPLLWHQHAKSQPLRWIRALSTAPAHILGQHPPSLQPGSPAEMVLFDPAERWIADRQHLQTPAQNTPWNHHEISGRVVKIWHPNTAAVA